MNHYSLRQLLTKVGEEPDAQVATELARKYVQVFVSEFGPDGAFDAGVDLGYVNCVRQRRGLPELELNGMEISS